jgi:secondary thiamine-phosphate synthase enzyme
VTATLARFGIQSRHDTELIDITDRVRELVRASGAKSGLVTVMTLHTTTAITINEGLPDLEADIVEFLQTVVASDGRYRHARFLHSDGQMAVNSPSHLRSAMLGMQVSLPIDRGELVLGERQRIYFVELDGPLHREAVVHVLAS